uniref:Uncharacterized protein n=1 Tax=Picea glauca TaxID=3330 RepID=A0A117NG37_PICGL|nr:hypothetical protein ABT39_MTgene1968 [Picea glauca]
MVILSTYEPLWKADSPSIKNKEGVRLVSGRELIIRISFLLPILNAFRPYEFTATFRSKSRVHQNLDSLGLVSSIHPMQQAL